jgi:2-amino-4-hydroxy-6-hydroxymethyldihydropteridine diphosphokinase
MTDGIFLLLGSNLGDQISQLARARLKLASAGIIRSSGIYRSAAWGPIEQPDFANQVIEIAYHGTPEALLSLILDIEKEMGRIRKEKWGPRLIDIDILYFHQKIRNTSRLILPHPEITRRRFTLVPMAELAPDFIHPVLQESQQILLEKCEDPLEVTPWN